MADAKMVEINPDSPIEDVDDLVYFSDINLSQTEDYEHFKDLIRSEQYEEAQEHLNNKGIKFYSAELINKFSSKFPFIFTLIQAIIKPIFHIFKSKEPDGDELNGDVQLENVEDEQGKKGIIWVDYEQNVYSEDAFNYIINPKFLQGFNMWYVSDEYIYTMDYEKHDGSNSVVLSKGAPIYQNVLIPQDDRVEELVVSFDYAFKNSGPQYAIKNYWDCIDIKMISEHACQGVASTLSNGKNWSNVNFRFPVDSSNYFTRCEFKLKGTNDWESKEDDLYISDVMIFPTKYDGNKAYNPYFTKLIGWSQFNTKVGDTVNVDNNKYVNIKSGSIISDNLDISLPTLIKGTACKIDISYLQNMHLEEILIKDVNRNVIKTISFNSEFPNHIYPKMRYYSTSIPMTSSMKYMTVQLGSGYYNYINIDYITQGIVPENLFDPYLWNFDSDEYGDFYDLDKDGVITINSGDPIQSYNHMIYQDVTVPGEGYSLSLDVLPISITNVDTSFKVLIAKYDEESESFGNYIEIGDKSFDQSQVGQYVHCVFNDYYIWGTFEAGKTYRVLFQFTWSQMKFKNIRLGK